MIFAQRLKKINKNTQQKLGNVLKCIKNYGKCKINSANLLTKR